MPGLNYLAKRSLSWGYLQCKTRRFEGTKSDYIE